MRAPKGTPTGLNVWVMAKLFYGGGRVGRTKIDAGYVTISDDKKHLLLTPAGVEAIEKSGWKPSPMDRDHDEDAEVLRRMRGR